MIFTSLTMMVCMHVQVYVVHPVHLTLFVMRVCVRVCYIVICCVCMLCHPHSHFTSRCVCCCAIHTLTSPHVVCVVVPSTHSLHLTLCVLLCHPHTHFTSRCVCCCAIHTLTSPHIVCVHQLHPRRAVSEEATLPRDAGVPTTRDHQVSCR